MVGKIGDGNSWSDPFKSTSLIPESSISKVKLAVASVFTLEAAVPIYGPYVWNRNRKVSQLSDGGRVEQLAEQQAIESPSSPPSSLPALANFREQSFILGGHRLEVAGMRHPDTQGGLSMDQVCDNLKERGFAEMISLEERKGEKLAELWTDPTHVRYLVKVPDFTPLTIDQSIEICQIAQHAAQAGTKLIIHCGEGWGRTGSALSVLALMSIMQETKTDDPYWGSEPEQTRIVHLGAHGGGWDIPTTPFVARAIQAVREGDKFTENEDSSRGSSVETERQVRALEDLERYLRVNRWLLS